MLLRVCVARYVQLEEMKTQLKKGSEIIMKYSAHRTSPPSRINPSGVALTLVPGWAAR